MIYIARAGLAVIAAPLLIAAAAWLAITERGMTICQRAGKVRQFAAMLPGELARFVKTGG